MAEQQPEITVLVAAHNEAERIQACLNAIVKQDYPMERVEILLVDDRSTDDTVERALAMNIKGLRVLRIDTVPEKLTARQAALHEGMMEARGEIVLITDAGGRVPREWIRELSGHLGYRDGAATAPVLFAGPGHAFNRYQTVDSLVRFTLFRWAYMHKFISGLQGANMAVRREAYLETGGFPVIGFAPAEDLALASALMRANWSMRYLPGPAVLNPTCRSIFELVSRSRRRIHNTPPALTSVATICIVSNIILVLLALFGHGIWLSILLIRYVIGLLVIGVAVSQYGLHKLHYWILVYEPLMTLLGLWVFFSNLVKPQWQWGGLSYDKQGPTAAAGKSGG